MVTSYRKEHPRLVNNLAFGCVSVVGCLVTFMVTSPEQSIWDKLSLGTGYLGLGLIVLTLLIGPLNMLKVRKNPVNIMFRRDAGIWAAITSVAHIVFSVALQLDWGGTLLGFFLYKDGSIKLNLYGVSNYVGLLATLVIIFLLVLSNNWSLKALKGKRWKAMQRFNYLLFGAALVHTFTQQANNARTSWLIMAVVVTTAVVMGGQFFGFVIYRQREQQRKMGQSRAAQPYLNAGPGFANSTLQNTPFMATQGNTGTLTVSKTKLATAFGLTAVLGAGISLLGVTFINNQQAAATSSVTALNDSGTTPEAEADSSTNTNAVANEEASKTSTVADTATPETSPTATATATPAPTTTPTPRATSTPASSAQNGNGNQANATATPTPTPVPATRAPKATATPVPATKAPTATPVPASGSTTTRGKTSVSKPSSKQAPIHTGGS